MDKEYTFEKFIEELYERHEDAKRRYLRVRKESFFKIGKNINELFNKGFGICLVEDLYMNRPASKFSNYMLNFVKDYIVSAKALIELKNYMGK